jgi:uncharacterized glyoxalase superfamily protein PhnB
MSDSVSPIPPEHSRLIPHLIVDRGPAALELYANAFGASEVVRLMHPDGEKLLYSELRIGDATLCVFDEIDDKQERSPTALGGTTGSLWLYVEDVDATLEQAVGAGCELVSPAQDAFWGDRVGKVRDPFGHIWSVASRVKEMTPEEVAAAAQQALAPE